MNAEKTKTTAAQEGLIGEFLFAQLHPQVAGAYKIIVKLQYPITDRNSFLRQLGGADKQRNSSEALSATLLKNVVQASDFPIMTQHSGMEKLHARLGPNVMAIGPYPWPIRFNTPQFTVTPGQFLERRVPDVRRIYEQVFSGHPECVEEAWNTYVATHGYLPDAAADEVNAFYNGLRVGTACVARH